MPNGATVRLILIIAIAGVSLGMACQLENSVQPVASSSLATYVPDTDGILLFAVGDIQNNMDAFIWGGRQTPGQPAYVRAQADFIMQHDVAAVLNVGDFVNRGCLRPDPWIDARWALDPIVSAGVPYISCVGNHDVGELGTGGADESSDMYNQYFGVPVFENQYWWGGTLAPGNADNYYITFDSGLYSFVVVSVRYDPELEHPEWIEWADSIFESYPRHNGIFLSHALLGSRTGTWPANFYGQGELAWETFKDNKNVFLMITGHHDSEAKRVDTWNNHTIHTIMSNYQFRPLDSQGHGGGSGWLRGYTLQPDKKRIRAWTHNAMTGEYETDLNSAFDLKWSHPIKRHRLSGDPPEPRRHKTLDNSSRRS
jgi:hypothetical protein